MVADPNAHVKSFLDYYLQPQNELDYAVLLSGRWGSGKTHLIRTYVEQTGAKHFFVSLNGMTSVRQIEEEFFRQRHPVLASKGMRVAGALLRGAIKTTLKIDLNADGKEEGTVTAQLPEIDLVKELGNPKDYVLIFDDLERCSLTVPSVLGYINAFVEQDGMKIIVLANEEELDKSEKAYARIKEKLFGQTLRVSPNADAAFDRFVSDIPDQRTREFLNARKELIVGLHRESTTENLRLLKHAIWDFARVASAMKERHWSKPDAATELLKVIFALSFEARSGRVTKPDMLKMVGLDYTKFFERHKSETKTLDQEVEERYPSISFQNVTITGESLQHLLFDGWIEPAAIESELDSSPSFGDKDSVAAWRRGWESFEMPDAEFADLVKDLEQEFSSRTLSEAGPLMHLFGIRLHLAEIGAIPETKSQVTAACKSYIDDLLKQGRAPNSLEERLDMTGFAGLGFHNRDTPEFRQILAHLNKVAEKATDALLPKFGAELIDKLDDDPDEFLLDLVYNKVKTARFARFPVLAHIEPETFVSKILSVQPSTQTKALRALKDRYETGALQSDLKRELPWLRKVRQQLLSAAKSAQPNTRARLTSQVEHSIDASIATVPEKPKKRRKSQVDPTEIEVADRSGNEESPAKKKTGRGGRKG